MSETRRVHDISVQDSYARVVVLLPSGMTVSPVAVVSFPAEAVSCNPMLLTPLVDGDDRLDWSLFAVGDAQNVGEWCDQIVALGFVVAHAEPVTAMSAQEANDLLIDEILDLTLFDPPSG